MPLCSSSFCSSFFFLFLYWPATPVGLPRLRLLLLLVSAACPLRILVLAGEEGGSLEMKKNIAGLSIQGWDGDGGGHQRLHRARRSGQSLHTSTCPRRAVDVPSPSSPFRVDVRPPETPWLTAHARPCTPMHAHARAPIDCRPMHLMCERPMTRRRRFDGGWWTAAPRCACGEPWRSFLEKPF